MKMFLLIFIGIVIVAVGLYAYQDPVFRSQASDFVMRFLESNREAPAPKPTARAMAALPEPTATPTQVAPAEVPPTFTPIAAPSPTAAPSPAETPEPSHPTVDPTFTPMPTPIPASYSIEVVSMEVLDDGQVDFTLEVRNDQVLEGEIAQLQMSVDGGAPELVNTIVDLPQGESESFTFARSLPQGTHKIKFSVGDSHKEIRVNVGERDIIITPVPTSYEDAGLVYAFTVTPPVPPSPEPKATPTATKRTLTNRVNLVYPTPTNTPGPMFEEKTYMLELINAERAKVGLNPVALGSNVAPQLHAEASLENCFSSHWGIDGLKPYMRYSLAGGYQSNGENGSERSVFSEDMDYCVKSSDSSLLPSTNIRTAIKEAMEGWMGSPGHRDNILGKWHKKVSIGLAWDSHSFYAYQHFEGDYIEYDEPPSIENGVLRISGRTKNGARFIIDAEPTVHVRVVQEASPSIENNYDLPMHPPTSRVVRTVTRRVDPAIEIYYDPPTHPLTRGQVARTYCYMPGSPIALLLGPLNGSGNVFSESTTSTLTGTLRGTRTETTITEISVNPCPDPYDVPSDAPAPRSHSEAHRLWDAARRASEASSGRSITPPWVTASEWTTEGESFSVKADLSEILEKHGDGIYTVEVKGDIGDDKDVIISMYSIFHGVTPPDTYSQ